MTGVTLQCPLSPQPAQGDNAIIPIPVNEQPERHRGCPSEPTLQAELFPNPSIPSSWWTSTPSLPSKQHWLRIKHGIFRQISHIAKGRSERSRRKAQHSNASQHCLPLSQAECSPSDPCQPSLGENSPGNAERGTECWESITSTAEQKQKGLIQI